LLLQTIVHVIQLAARVPPRLRRRRDASLERLTIASQHVFFRHFPACTGALPAVPATPSSTFVALRQLSDLANQFSEAHYSPMARVVVKQPAHG
jgi:hypothetical protein